MSTISYIPNFVEDADNVFLRLKNELTWVRRESTPRKEVYMNDFPVPYTYGTPPYARTYMPVPYHDDVLIIRKKLEAELNCAFEVCFLNLYEDQSDQLGWHSDDSPEMDDLRPIVSISLGVEREIWFRKIPTLHKVGISRGELFVIGASNNTTKLKLEHGSACIMLPGMQDTHQHRIPKAGFLCGERISLTFRGYVQS